MNLDIVNIDPKILGGTPVFKGTRVPIETLFVHLEKGITIDEFLKDFPTVSKEQAMTVLEIAEKIITAKNLKSIYKYRN